MTYHTVVCRMRMAVVVLGFRPLSWLGYVEHLPSDWTQAEFRQQRLALTTKDAPPLGCQHPNAAFLGTQRKALGQAQGLCQRSQDHQQAWNRKGSR